MSTTTDSTTPAMATVTPKVPRGATCIVDLPDGTRAGRKTDRVFTHAVAVRYARWDWKTGVPVQAWEWKVSYCGSLGLARKELDAQQQKGWTIAEAVILPVVQVAA